jgi:hypothetical protein
MSRHRSTPVIIGVGDVVNRSKRAEDAVEPLQLMISAIQNAIQDSGIQASQSTGLQSQIDSIDVVESWTWPCDYPTLIADKLALGGDGESRLHLNLSPHGGNQPAKLVDEAARRISLGDSKVAIVTGGEALASRKELLLRIGILPGTMTDCFSLKVTACVKAGQIPPKNWTAPNRDIREVFSPTTREIMTSQLRLQDC